jgi:hypothetical protein
MWAGLALLGCQRAASPTNPSIEQCVDGWLHQRQLNPYGDPPDTAYAGGTPLFDEATGQTTPRVDWVLRHHPEIRQACMPLQGG